MAKELAHRDIYIIEGEDFAQSFSVKTETGDMDLTGYTAVGQVRRDFQISSEVLMSFDFDIAGNIITASIDRSVTYDIVKSTNKTNEFIRIGFYDIFLISPEEKQQYFIGGKVLYAQTITKEQ